MSVILKSRTRFGPRSWALSRSESCTRAPTVPIPPKCAFTAATTVGRCSTTISRSWRCPTCHRHQPEACLKQLAFLQSRGVTFHRRINHGMTHSVYISDPNGYGIEVLYELPREVWEGDIDAALNYAEPLPTEGDEALVDATDNVPVFGKA